MRLLQDFWNNDNRRYFVATVFGVGFGVGLFAIVYSLAFQWYTKWGETAAFPPPPASMSISNPQAAHKVAQYYQALSEVYIYQHAPGTIFQSLSVALGAVVAGLAAYKILPKKDDATPSPLGAIIGSLVACLTVLTTNANTYYASVKEQLDAARACRATIAGMDVDLPDAGETWTQEQKTAWRQELKTTLAKYPQILGATDPFHYRHKDGGGYGEDSPQVNTPTSSPTPTAVSQADAKPPK